MRFPDLLTLFSPAAIYFLDDNDTVCRDALGVHPKAYVEPYSRVTDSTVFGRSATQFNGGYLDFGADASALYDGASAVTFLISLSVNSLPTGNPSALVAWSFASGKNSVYIVIDSGGLLHIGGRSQGSDSFQSINGPTLTTGNTYFLGFELNFAANAIRVFQAGSKVVDSTVAFGSTSFIADASTENDRVLSYSGTGTQNARVTLYAFAVIPAALTADQHAALLTSLQLRRSVPVVTTIDQVSASRGVRVIRVSDGYAWAAINTASDGTGTITIDDDAVVNVVAYDDYGDKWRGTTTYAAGGRAIPNAPNGHWYQTTGGGVSGTAEPSWPTDGSTVTDGTVTWTDMGTMRAPVIQGPFVPVAT